MKVPLKKAILFVCLVVFSSPALAETGFQFAAPSLKVPNDPSVNGMRLSFIWGKNERQAGFDAGILSLSETDQFSGLGLIAGVSKVNQRMSDGVSFCLVNYHKGTDAGVNGAFINLLNEAGDAFNTGFVTIAKGGTSVDLGGFNKSDHSIAQIGFINVTREIKSFQFGFLNMAENGFLPIFPIFNFPKQ